MSAPQAQTTGGTKTYELRVPKGSDRKVFVSKFSNSLNVDFGTWKKNAPDFIREGAQNAARSQTSFIDEDAPKVGAGSEFGKDKRDEARRKKYTRRPRSDDVPWVMTDCVTNKKYRGSKEGGVQDNSSYYVFTTVGGRIEAYPVAEWFNFTPIQRYKALNEDEAEEAFEKRDKVFNYFNIMYQKRLKTTGEEAEDGAEDGDGKASGSGGRRGNLKIKDDDEDEKPATMSDSDEDGAADDTTAMAASKKKKGKGKKQGKKAPQKTKKQKKAEEDGDFLEPAEESDDGDYETRELDYETSSSEDEMEDVPEQEITPKGVDEEIEEMQADDDEEEEEGKGEQEGNKDNTMDDPLANSDSDNDEEDIDAIADSRIPTKRVDTNEAGPSTPSDKKTHSKSSAAKGTKRKQDSGSASHAGPSTSKKTKNEKPTGSDGTPTDGKLDEEALVRQYLTRKPITSKELLRKLTKRGVQTENLNNRVGEIIKRLNPEKTTHAGKLMLHLKT